MMNVKLLPIFIITLATVSTVSFGMELQTVPAKIIIQCKENNIELDNIARTKDKPGLGDILGTSQNLKNMLGDLGSKQQLASGEKLSIKQPIPLTQISAANFDSVYQYMLLLADKKKLNEDCGIRHKASEDSTMFYDKDTVTDMTFAEMMDKCAKLREEISDTLQGSSIEILCQQFPDFDYLDIRGQNKKKEDISFLDEHLIPTISNKFDYKKDNHYWCIENINSLDHKNSIAKNIAEKLSITTIGMSQANENPTDLNQVGYSILGRSLTLLKTQSDDNSSITSVSEKGNLFVAGFKAGQVAIGRMLECTQGMGSYPDAILAFLLPCMRKAANSGKHSVQRVSIGELAQCKVAARRLGRHNKAVTSVDLHPTKLFLVTADKQEVKLWNVKTMSCMRTFNKDSDGIFDPKTIRFNKAGDRIISGVAPVSSWEFHDPYEVLNYLMKKKETLGDKNSFIDDILKHVPDDRISWPQWLWNYKKRFLLGGLVIGGLLYYKRGALLSFLQRLYSFQQR